ncbi:MAG: helix-turn-helix domain-containing protein [Pseudorhodobacter sp.]|nr:helix-turn-helix domain-containing protein [Pseudorhodobacter sp.]
MTAALREALDAPSEAMESLQRQLDGLAKSVRDAGLTERALNLLIDTTHDLSSTLSLQDLLRTVVSRAHSLVAANIAWLTMLDEEDNVFRTVAAEGHLSPATAEMTSGFEYGAVSLVMKTKSFFDTQDYLADQRFQHTPDLDRVFQAEKIMSLVGFPILFEGRVQGLLFIADRYGRKLSGREISVLGSFALHAGVAMRNARAFSMLSDALAEAERNRAALIDHIQRVETSATMHDEMTSLLARGADLPVFMQRMANQIDGAILLLDAAQTVREEFASAAYQGHLAGEIREGRIDAVILILGIAKSRRSGRSVVLLDQGEERCLAIALHGGTGRGGSGWGESLVICHCGTLDAIDIRNLERSTVALSIAKLWTEKRETEKLIASSTLLRHLILVNPPDQSTIFAIRDRLSLRSDQPVQLTLIAVTGLDRAAQTEMVRNAAARLNLLVDLVDDTYLAVGPEEPIRSLVDKIARQGGVGGILSDPFTDVAQTAVQYRRLEQALRVLQKMGRLDRFLEQRQVNLFAKLFEGGDAGRIARYARETLARIEGCDPKRKTQLKQTLLCFFDCQYNIARAAEKLGIHINTVRQRLDTLRDITGGWDDPVAALELHVALRLDEITAA